MLDVADAQLRTTEYPRVLFVTPNAFNHFTGGGITFSNLFRGWPKDCLATVHNDEVPTTDDVCDRYFVVGRAEMDLFAPLRVVRALVKRRAHAGGAENRGATAPPGRGGIVARLQGDSAPQRVRLTVALDRWIADFRPELLYTILGSNAFMALTAAIRRRFNLPMVVHMMDDFPTSNYRRGAFAPIERALMRRLLADNFRAATARMGICADMCTAFSQRYGHPFVPFQNCVDVERWRPLVRTGSAVVGSTVRLLYYGSVFANAQLESLADLCRSVARLSEGGMPITFEIAAPAWQVAPYRGALAIHKAISLVEPTEDDREYFAALAAADVLVLPVNYDAETVDYIRYSMPTKVPAYMASGTPILVYGPRGVAQADYAGRDGWGHVVSERDPQALDEALRRILSDGALRETLRLRAQALASANHDSVQVRTKFQEALKSAARAGA
jgi:glycosyltransferase involved in cell wall biosynthesis